MRGLAAALLGVLALGSAAAAAEPWEALAPDGAGFRALLPGRPGYERSSRLTPLGRVVEHLYTLEQDGTSYWITWTEVPRLARLFVGEEGIYARVREQVVGDGGGREVSFGPVLLGSHGGRELVYRVAGENGEGARAGRLKAFLVGTRLYVFDTTAPEAARSAAAERFFASLRLEEVAPSLAGGS